MNTDVVKMVEIARTADLKSGEMKMVSLEGQEILLARVGDSWYAAENRCPHMGGNLSKGKLEGKVVTCPRHQSQFDLRDGHIVRWTTWPGALVAIDQVRSHRRPLKVFAVKIEGDKVLVNYSD